MMRTNEELLARDKRDHHHRLSFLHDVLAILQAQEVVIQEGSRLPGNQLHPTKAQPTSVKAPLTASSHMRDTQQGRESYVQPNGLASLTMQSRSVPVQHKGTLVPLYSA